MEPEALLLLKLGIGGLFAFILLDLGRRAVRFYYPSAPMRPHQAAMFLRWPPVRWPHRAYIISLWSQRMVFVASLALFVMVYLMIRN